jgi:hypothetical protein
VRHPEAGSFAKVDRLWEGRSQIELELPAAPELWRGYRDAVAIRRGPLVFALRIGEDWRRINADAPYRELPHADWEVYPTSLWAFGLDVQDATIVDDVAFEQRPMNERPFSPEGAPLIATVRGREIPTWRLEHGSAADAPHSPTSSEAPEQELTLIPYGCTNLRITEFPQLVREG